MIQNSMVKKRINMKTKSLRYFFLALIVSQAITIVPESVFRLFIWFVSMIILYFAGSYEIDQENKLS
jgi:uncharacterized membrane protein YdbT with pleckstrin-like domain